MDKPTWMTDEGLKTLQRGYLLPGETPVKMYMRVAEAAAKYTYNPDYWMGKFFHAMWGGFLCPASPVLSNMGTERGLPISCNGLTVPDSVDGIFSKSHELAMLSKNGAGVAIDLGNIRPSGAGISGNGRSEGVIPWCRVYDTTTVSVSQGSTRRGASVVYLPIDHGDIHEFLDLRRTTGDVNRRCLNLNHGVCITDQWMAQMLAGDVDKRALWLKLLQTRFETGEPYIFFTDNVNRANPPAYIQNGLSVSCSNLCVAGDTLVLTRQGPQAIETLVDQTVEVWDGESWVSTNSFKQRGVSELTRVTVKDGSYVDADAQHRWFVAKSYNDIRLGKYRETTTADLKVGDYIQCHTQTWDGDVELKGAYLKGFLLGDGTSHKNMVQMNLHSTKYSCMQALSASSREILEQPIFFGEERNHTGFKGTWGKQIFRTVKGWANSHEELLPWVTTVRYEGLPVECHSWSRASKLALLAGLLDSDGTCAKHSCSLQITNINKNFIVSLQLLLKSMGIWSNMDEGLNSSGNTWYRLTLTSWAGWQLLKELPVHRIKYEGPEPNRQTTGWRRVESLEKLDGFHPVYCPSIPSTGKFGLANGLMTGNCSEITLFSDADHTFVCCLSSLNLTTYSQWPEDLVETSIRFLDCVIEDYLVKTAGRTGMEAAHRAALKGRSIGLGALGWHTLLQQRNIAFDSFDAMKLNAEIWRYINARAVAASRELATVLGEPEWCRGTGMRNTHLLSVAPTLSNSSIAGGHSAGIEPIAANAYAFKSAKGVFLRKNPTLERVLDGLGMNTPETWKSIVGNQGSVQHLEGLDEHTKQVFLTAREIDQMAIVRQAAQRQKYIDQSQSLNLFFGTNTPEQYVHDVHVEAWKQGVKTLYYCRAEGVISADQASRDSTCKACEG